MQLVVAIEPRSYRQVIGEAIRALRPHVEVTVLEPGTLGAGVVRLKPELVFATRRRAHGPHRLGGVSPLRGAAGAGVLGWAALGTGGGGAL